MDAKVKALVEAAIRVVNDFLPKNGSPAHTNPLIRADLDALRSAANALIKPPKAPREEVRG